MNIQRISKKLEKLWATTVSQVNLDLNDPSIEFHISANKDDYHCSRYRLRCSGLIGIEYSREPIHWDYAELTSAQAKKISIDGFDSIRLELEIWSSEMAIQCLAVDVETIAEEES